MAHPIIETKWQLDKIRELVNQLDRELDEAEYQASQAEETIEQASEWEEAKGNIESLARQAITYLKEAHVCKSPDDLMDRINFAIDELLEITKELEK